jgi:diaminohydroxyphosphoribosylaminopyrimidine deaminase / 5-amino-6-(5-phosphoribosylamino)uracil reductase
LKDFSEAYMHRALELAERARQTVSPNPMVGCVIVHEGTIIGEGFHRKYGDAHAEVDAIRSVKNEHLLKEATLYVTLEPCAHYGKTPPCANLIVAKKIPRVVVCNQDPNPLVAGKGIEILKEAGIEVIVGMLQKEGEALNRRFFTYHRLKRPYITLKWAQTADGFIARENHDSKWISDEFSRMLSHKWRSEEDALMVGTLTALHDNPTLNNRHWSGYSPVRVVIDRQLRLERHMNLFDQSQTTLCYNQSYTAAEEYNQFIQLDFTKDLVPQIVEDLYVRKIQSRMVVG